MMPQTRTKAQDWSKTGQPRCSALPVSHTVLGRRGPALRRRGTGIGTGEIDGRDTSAECGGEFTGAVSPTLHLRRRSVNSVRTRGLRQNRLDGLASVKRLIDLTGATAALAVTSPLILAAALLTWRAHGRPVFHRQRRAGLHGQAIVVVKLRTMTDDRDDEGNLLPDDQRLSLVGMRFRRWSLDELPQLWNVLKGEMSLVGPRPLPLEYVERYSVEQRRRLDVKPGITGWSQIHGRNALSWPEKLSLDVWYVDHASTRLDVRILAGTVRAVIRGDGIGADGHVTMPEFRGER
jgi:sugar transferase EpsL